MADFKHKEIEQLLVRALQAISNSNTILELEDTRVKFIGKNGELTLKQKTIGTLPATERPQFGEEVNKARNAFDSAFQEKTAQLQQQELEAKLNASTVDVTLPGRGMPLGTLHPVTKTRLRLEQIFKSAGFIVASGPEIEDDYHNFEALNIPAHHPARAMQDTFYFADGKLLRTHTSPVQIRVMQSKGAKPPFRLIAPGRVYRCDSDITHTPMFHQIEGLVVDDTTTIANLKATLQNLLQVFFEQPVNIRLRSSYFPFTEPSAEVDMECTACKGSGCRICSNTGWLEILGCGMVHPKVLENCGIDSEKYTGWAFGMGIDRLAMLRYGIPDLRMMFENDLRFLAQF
jgi:phenylalanyl-tRNA synthetase alpha chain